MADAIVINKVNTAPPGAVDALRTAAAAQNPSARVYATDSTITVDAPEVLCAACRRHCCRCSLSYRQCSFSRHEQITSHACSQRQLTGELPFSSLKSCRVLVEDGPTLTHGGMPYGAGKVRSGAPARDWNVCVQERLRPPLLLNTTPPSRASDWGGCMHALYCHRTATQYAAEKYGAAEVVDPRPYLVGSLAATYRQYPHLGKLLPAMGYFPQQVWGGWAGGPSSGSQSPTPCRTSALRLVTCSAQTSSRHSTGCRVSRPLHFREPQRPSSSAFRWALPLQVADLEASLNAVPCDGVVVATPMDLRRLLRVDKPATAVSAWVPACSACSLPAGADSRTRFHAAQRHLCPSLLPSPPILCLPAHRSSTQWRTASRVPTCPMRWTPYC